MRGGQGARNDGTQHGRRVTQVWVKQGWILSGGATSEPLAGGGGVGRERRSIADSLMNRDRPLIVGRMFMEQEGDGAI